MKTIEREQVYKPAGRWLGSQRKDCEFVTAVRYITQEKKQHLYVLDRQALDTMIAKIELNADFLGIVYKLRWWSYR